MAGVSWAKEARPASILVTSLSLAIWAGEVTVAVLAVVLAVAVSEGAVDSVVVSEGAALAVVELPGGGRP